MESVWQWVLGHWAFCAFVLTIFVDLTPGIKWNPIKAIFGWIGKLINKGVLEQITSLKGEVNEIKDQVQANEKDRIRFEVLSFANSCRNKVKHTKDEFQHIIDINDKYENLLKATEDKNGVFVEEYKYIMEIYHRCQQENSFLA